MRVLVVGAGLMGAQIGVEYALGGHEVTLTARHPDQVAERAENSLELVAAHGLAEPDQVAAARGRIEIAGEADPAGWELVVESVPERLDLKAELLGPSAAASPEATLASNTSSLSIGELGDAIGAPERTVGTHYLNPPLLMPPVEVIAGPRTDHAVADRVRDVLRALGKRPVAVERDVPGFVWNRIQTAVLREAVWLVENGVCTPDTVDEVLTYGLARRWRNVGFFRAIALGGVQTWQRSTANLLPEISAAREIGDLRRWVSENGDLEDTVRRRDRGLAEDLLGDRKAGA
jgi:3-hydroxybutyryl-CoA dehydrogenase